MEFSKLFVFVEILRDSFKLISKNRKTIAFVAAITILIRSSIFVIVTFSTRHTIKNLFGQQLENLLASASTPAFSSLLVETKHRILFVLAIEWVMILISVVVSLFSMGSIILVSAAAYYGKSLDFQDLALKVANSFMKLFVTSFHITMVAMGYFFSFFVIIVPPLFLIFDFNQLTEITVFMYPIFGVLLISVLYLSIVWMLAIVITIVEENCFGIEALGQAARLIKGKKIQGFALNFTIMLGTMIIQGLASNYDETSISKQVAVGIFMICVNFMVSVLQYASYTILYFQCKENHGEEIKSQGEWGYNKVALATLDFL